VNTAGSLYFKHHPNGGVHSVWSLLDLIEHATVHNLRIAFQEVAERAAEMGLFLPTCEQ